MDTGRDQASPWRVINDGLGRGGDGAPSDGDLAPSLGDEIFFRRTQDFLMTFLGGKISIFAAKISDNLFLVIDQVFRIFPLFPLIFRIFTLLDIVHNPFLARKTFF